ncbi:ARM repeat-containing protein [Neoconidiobolus thromboides FSU 785]|nr:ARM repeat-containing protein [Neoconidiobolus thromboides FSU 785]
MENRIQLIKKNLHAWIEKPEIKPNLDSNFKKNTSFIKKCRASLNSDNCQSLLKDINTLSLEKYITEVVSGISEGILKCKTGPSIQAAVEVISALHQRFPDTFTIELFDVVRKMLSVAPTKTSLLVQPNQNTVDKEKEDASRILKQRTVLKVITEIWLVGVFWGIENGFKKFPEAKEVAKKIIDSLDDLKQEAELKDRTFFLEGPVSGPWNTALRNNHLGIVYHSIKTILSTDRDKFTNLSLVVSFLKSFGYDVLRISPRSQGSENTKENKENPKSNEEQEKEVKSPVPKSHIMISILTNEQVEAFRELFTSYAKELSKNLVRDHKAIKKEERINHERSIARGEVNDEAKLRYETHFKAYEKNLQNMEAMMDYLNMDMPELPNDSVNSAISGVVVNEFGFNRGEGENVHEGGPWEDDDARTFYTKLLDLKSLVPGILLGIEPSNPASDDRVDEQEKDDVKEDLKESLSNKSDENIAATETIQNEKAEEDPNLSFELDEDNLEDTNEEKTTASAQMTAFLVGLQNMGNRDLIDQAAVEFCYINNKASRKRLIRSLIQVPQKRLDLLSYYSRFIGTLTPYFPDIGKSIEAGLEKEFKFLLHKKTSNVGDSNLLERRVKNIRYLAELTKFSLLPVHFAFFILKSLLDNFLHPGNIEIISNYLEIDIMMKKKASSHLNERLEMMIENAFYQCNPPEQSAVVKKILSPMEQFIRSLLLVESSRFPLEKLIKIVRRLPWNDESIYSFIFKTVSKIHKNKYSHIQPIAALMGALIKYQPIFVEDVVDQVLEDVTVGLEMKYLTIFKENNYKFNQKRISQVKFIAELFNYRVVGPSVIFNLLLLIVSFGYPNGRPSRDYFNPFDVPDDCFRIRLCCTILDTCGVYFNAPSSRSIMNEFLTLFQLYILSKPFIPIDVQFAINDTFELLRPKLNLFVTYEEAEEALIKIAQNKKQYAFNTLKVPAANPQREVSDIEEDQESSSEDDQSEGSGNEKEEEDLEDSDVSEEPVEDDEKIILLNKLKKEQDEDLRRQEEEEFEKEYQSMMASTIDSRKLERKVVALDVPIPMKLLDKNKQAEIEDGGSQVAFSLLTKRGNKQHVRTVGVPSDNALAIQTLNKQKAERIEQQQLKKIVLGYDTAKTEDNDYSSEKPVRSTNSKAIPSKYKAKYGGNSQYEPRLQKSYGASKPEHLLNSSHRDEAAKSNGRQNVTQTFDLSDLIQKNPTSSRGNKGRG